MSKFLQLILGVCICGLGGLRAQEPGSHECTFTCGLNAAYLLLDKTGRHTSYEELKKDFERQHPPDSLLAIREVLKEHGCTTKGVRTSAEFFLNNGGPSIVYLKLKTGYALNEGHFALLVNAGRQTGVKLLDPVFETNGGSLISWDSFSRIYQGSALVLE